MTAHASDGPIRVSNHVPSATRRADWSFKLSVRGMRLTCCGLNLEAFGSAGRSVALHHIA
eukprot:6866332-Pyramimonas_sp.AAC.1